MFELNRKEIQYQFRYPNVATPLIATLAWPTPAEFRALYADMKVEAKNVGDRTLELKVGDNPHFFPFLQEHLIGIASGNARKLAFTVDELKEQMQKNRKLDASRALVLESLLSADVSEEIAVDSEQELTLDEIAKDIICIEIDCWDGEKNARHVLGHSLAVADAGQRKAYKDAQRFRQKRNRTFQEQDVHAVTSLYEARVQSIDGASWDGQPCTVENRDAWLKSVPYPWINTVMTEDDRVADKVGPT